jgi:site-specific DNA-methyltransferase (cytosine-N4-specific)
MCQVVEGNLLTPPDIPQLDLMVCSPPYPNAYSYHLYHMTRMIWLGMDQPLFKKQEIGSHRKYSSNSKNGATVETFKAEFSSILAWLSSQLKAGGYACFVVGDSTLKGQRINNADLISDVGQAVGFQEVMRIDRTMQSSKKSFNPAIGKIKTENILILQNAQ